MIDVHAPHERTHTWRDIFIHLAIVIVGILIAIGLEQSLEFFHHRYQLHELRLGAIDDAQIYHHDVDENRAAENLRIEDLSRRIQQVRETISQHQPLPQPAYRPEPAVDTVRLGNLAAAKSSGLIDLLTTNEINSFSDAEVGVARWSALSQSDNEAATKRIAFEQRFQPVYPNGPFDFSRISPAQLDEYLGLLVEERLRRSDTLAYLDAMHRGSEAFLRGQRDLEKLRESERSSAP